MRAAVILANFVSLLFYAEVSAKIQLYTIETPPTVVRNGPGIEGLQGEFGKVISSTILKSHHKDQIEIVWLPWKRALVELERNKKALFFPFTRTKDREFKFNWVLHLAEFDCWLYSVNPAVKLNSLFDLLKYRVGVLGGSAREQELRKYMGNSEKVEGMTEDLQNYRKLRSGRIDIWATQPIMAEEAQKRYAQLDKKDPEMKALKKLLSQSLWLAGNKGMSDQDKAIVREVFSGGDTFKSIKSRPLSLQENTN